MLKESLASLGFRGYSLFSYQFNYQEICHITYGMSGNGTEDEHSFTKTWGSSSTPGPLVTLCNSEVGSFILTTTKNIQYGLTVSLMNCHLYIFESKMPL